MWLEEDIHTKQWVFSQDFNISLPAHSDDSKGESQCKSELEKLRWNLEGEELKSKIIADSSKDYKNAWIYTGINALRIIVKVGKLLKSNRKYWRQTKKKKNTHSSNRVPKRGQGVENCNSRTHPRDKYEFKLYFESTYHVLENIKPKQSTPRHILVKL